MMNSDSSNLRQQQEQAEQLSSAGQHRQQSGEKEFASAEDLLKYDSETNPVPESVAERLNETLAKEPQLQGSWWQRIFGGGK